MLFCKNMNYLLKNKQEKTSFSIQNLDDIKYLLHACGYNL
jgi:hypothetical protein